MAHRANTPQSGKRRSAQVHGEDGLTEGQRRRIDLFRSLESGICSRVEDMCGTSALEVTDVAVLVVSQEAYPLVFDTAESPGASVVLGHRERLYDFLRTSLPSADDAPVDPYCDLLEPAPARCVRVLVVDDESLTILSYGTFVTVVIDDGDVPQA
jgi:hypothetical protein